MTVTDQDLWQTESIGDLLDLVIDYRGKTPPKSNAGIPTLTAGNIKNGRVDLSKTSYVSEETYQHWKTRGLVKPGDVLITTEAPVGEVAILPDDQTYLITRRLMALRSSQHLLDNRFLYYSLRDSATRNRLLSSVRGSTVPRVLKPDILNLEISFPSLEKQKAIAAVLGAFDDKIELNRQMNATLEEMARAIFKSWFVDFDPVRAKARGEEPYGMDAETAALFPDRFEVVNGREVPAGWEVGALGDIAQNVRRSIKANEIPPDTPYIGLQHMPQESIALADWGRAEEINSNKSEFRKGEFLFGKLRPYFHKVRIAPVDGVSSTDILTIVPITEAMNGLVLAHISSIKFVDYTTAVSTGTRMPRTNWKNMSQYELVIPPALVTTVFNGLVTPMFEYITNNIFESRTLASTRDTLLPTLMSGQLCVPIQIENKFSAVA